MRALILSRKPVGREEIWPPSSRSLVLGPIKGSCPGSPPHPRSGEGPATPGVLGGGVVSIARELVLEGDERLVVDWEDCW